MALEDGRFLCRPDRYDLLVRSNVDPKNLIRVSTNFQVIALGVPIPPYPGFPLDPPFRSRFQARNIRLPSFDDELEHLIRRAPSASNALRKILSIANVMRSLSSEAIRLPEFPSHLETCARILSMYAEFPVGELINLIYPYPAMRVMKDEQAQIWINAIKSFALADEFFGNLKSFENETATKTTWPDFASRSTLAIEKDTDLMFVSLPSQQKVLSSMDALQAVNMDFCLLGPKGCGKSVILRQFARLAGHTIQMVPLYRDMPSRDLFQIRSTDSKGQTIWYPIIRKCLDSLFQERFAAHRSWIERKVGGTRWDPSFANGDIGLFVSLNSRARNQLARWFANYQSFQI